MDKPIIQILTFILLIITASCNKYDEPLAENEETGIISFSLQIDNANINETRSLAPNYHFSDGRSISVIKCYVYNQNLTNAASAEPVEVYDITLTDLKGNFSLRLPKKDTYDLVFLATSIPQNNPSSKLYYSPKDRILTVNYSSIYSNDEEMDCFYAVKTGVTVFTNTTNPIVLKRPLAQINIGAKDFNAYNASYPVKDVSVTVSGIYNKFNLMNGNISGEPITVNFLPSAVPSGQTFPVSSSTYLAMNYVLVNLRKLVDVSIVINHHNSSYKPMDMTFQNIAVERNYQTNLYIKSLAD